MGLFDQAKAALKNAQQSGGALSKGGHGEVVYGVTDRRESNFITRANDWLIDHSPVSGKEKGMMFYSLQMLVNSGVEFTRALEILAGRTRNPRLQRVLRTVVYDMKYGGLSFSRALAKYPNVFRESEVKMVYSGEVTGKIEETLSSISEQIQKNLDLEGQVKSALMYPATVMGAIVIAGGVVVTVIVPQFMVLFQQFESTLPASTKFLLWMSDFLRGYWWLILACLVGAWLLFQNWKSTDSGKRSWGGLMLKLPLVGGLVRNIQTVRISQNLGTLLKSGVQVESALQILGEIMPNKVVGDAVFRIKNKVLQGNKLSQSFLDEPSLDSIVGEVVSIGERTGQVPEVLHKTGVQYEKEVDAQLKNLTTIIEPVIIIFVGAAVVFMAMSILAPIFQLQELFSQV